MFKPVKHLTMKQVRNLKVMGDDDADAYAIAWSCEVDVNEVRAWADEARAGDVARVIAEVFEISGMGKDATFPG